MTPDELLDIVDDTLLDWRITFEDVVWNGPDDIVNTGKWVLHYAKTKGWYL